MKKKEEIPQKKEESKPKKSTNSPQVIPIIVAVGMFFLFFSDYYQGGMTGAEGFYLGVGTAIIILIILGIILYLISISRSNSKTIQLNKEIEKMNYEKMTYEYKQLRETLTHLINKIDNSQIN